MINSSSTSAAAAAAVAAPAQAQAATLSKDSTSSLSPTTTATSDTDTPWFCPLIHIPALVTELAVLNGGGKPSYPLNPQHCPSSSIFHFIKVPSMAWRSSGSSNKDLIENLWRNGLIKRPEVRDAFLKVDRAHYAPTSPYEDSPQPIGHSATISAPHMHASAVENLLPYLLPSERNGFAPRVLDIGSGSGYLTHVMAELVGDKGGRVVGVEHIKELKELGEANMKKSPEGRRFLEGGRVEFGVGDGRLGWKDGDDEEGNKWDAIHVGASATEVHKELLDQLKSPGRMFIPVDDEGSGGWGQHVWCVDKDERGRVEKKQLFGVRYVPLTDAPRG